MPKHVSDLRGGTLLPHYLLFVSLEVGLAARRHVGAQVRLRQPMLAAILELAELAVADDHGILLSAPTILTLEAADRLASSPQPQYKMKRRFLLDVIVREGAAVLKLFSRKDEALLIRGNTCEPSWFFLCPSLLLFSFSLCPVPSLVLNQTKGNKKLRLIKPDAPPQCMFVAAVST